MLEVIKVYDEVVGEILEGGFEFVQREVADRRKEYNDNNIRTTVKFDDELECNKIVKI